MLTVHTVAMLLQPVTLPVRSTQFQQTIAIDWLRSHIIADTREQSVELQKGVTAAYLEFRQQTGVFNIAGGTQAYMFAKESPLLFWRSFVEDDSEGVRELARIAVTIFTAVANSVSSERAFSAMNLIHSKMRGSLGATKADKLIYIYMNERVLAEGSSNIMLGDPFEKTEEEQLELERQLLEVLAEDGFVSDEDELEEREASLEL